MKNSPKSLSSQRRGDRRAALGLIGGVLASPLIIGGAAGLPPAVVERISMFAR